MMLNRLCVMTMTMKRQMSTPHLFFDNSNPAYIARKMMLHVMYLSIGKRGSGLFLHSRWTNAYCVEWNGFFIKSHESGYERAGEGLIFCRKWPLDLRNIQILNWFL
jgi:hypothetical protein